MVNGKLTAPFSRQILVIRKSIIILSESSALVQYLQPGPFSNPTGYYHKMYHAIPKMYLL